MIWPHGAEQHRATAMGRRGVVACAHPFAAQAGLDMLRMGGNAVDALIAMSAVLGVVEPNAVGAGGMGIMTIAPPGASEPIVLDFVGPLPLAASLEAFKGRPPGEPGFKYPATSHKDHGIRSSIVPGNLAAWVMALDRFGYIDRATVLAPAIAWAQDGFPISPYLLGVLTATAPVLAPYADTARIFLPEGSLPGVGQLLRQTDLAETLRSVAADGLGAINGSIADSLAAYSEQNGGLLAREDFDRWGPEWVSPISIRYGDATIFAPPPPCSALQYLLTLNIMAGYDQPYDPTDALSVHRMIEACKFANVDRITWTMTDPEAWHVLLTSEYARSRRDLIDDAHAAVGVGDRFSAAAMAAGIVPGSVQAIMQESTTHLVAMDEEGWMASSTQTIGGGPARGFGSGVVFGKTGLLLNNGAHWFDDDPESPNFIRPGRKGEKTLSPSQIWRNGMPWACVGTPGSWGILQTTPQMLLGVLHDAPNIQALIERPRFRLSTGRKVQVESRFGAVQEGLEARGHELVRLPAWSPVVGGAQGLVRLENGLLTGGADPRRDGIALAW